MEGLTMPGIFEAVVQGSALVIVAWVIFHVFSKILPEFAEQRKEDTERFTTALKEQREVFVNEMRYERQELKETLQGLTRAVSNHTELLVRHDSQVRGINPKISGQPLSDIREGKQ